MAELHPDFLRAPVPRRWYKPLRGLWVQLVGEAKRDSDWQWRALPHGAFVGLRLLGAWRRELKISRLDVEGGLSEEQKGRWSIEVKTFLKQFAIEAVDGSKPCQLQGNEWYWEGVGDQPTALLQELARGETKPGYALCWDCLQESNRKEVPHFIQGGPEGQRCAHHAMVAGREEAERHAAKRKAQRDFDLMP